MNRLVTFGIWLVVVALAALVGGLSFGLGSVGFFASLFIGFLLGAMFFVATEVGHGNPLVGMLAIMRHPLLGPLYGLVFVLGLLSIIGVLVWKGGIWGSARNSAAGVLTPTATAISVAPTATPLVTSVAPATLVPASPTPVPVSPTPLATSVAPTVVPATLVPASPTPASSPTPLATLAAGSGAGVGAGGVTTPVAPTVAPTPTVVSTSVAPISLGDFGSGKNGAPTNGAQESLFGWKAVDTSTSWEPAKWDRYSVDPNQWFTVTIPTDWEATVTKLDGSVVAFYGPVPAMRVSGVTLRHLPTYVATGQTWVLDKCELLRKENVYSLSKDPAYRTLAGNFTCSVCPGNPDEVAVLLGGTASQWKDGGVDFGFQKWIFAGGDGSFHLVYPGFGSYDHWKSGNGVTQDVPADTATFNAFGCVP